MKAISRNEKAYSTTIFIVVLSLFIIAILILFFVKWTSDLGTGQRKAQYVLLDQKIKKETATVLFGTVKKATFQAPQGTRACFIDSSEAKRNYLLDTIHHQTPLMISYPWIKQIIDPSTGVDRNIIYIKLPEGTLIQSRWDPNICYKNPPYYSCIESQGTDFTAIFQGISVEGTGPCVTIWPHWGRSLGGDNQHDLPKYYNSVFLAWDNDTKHSNWPSILTLIPLSRWEDGFGGTSTYPYSIFYSNGPIDNSTMINIINNSGGQKGYIYGISPLFVPNGELNGSSGHFFYNITPDNVNQTNGYFTFWKRYDDVVITALSENAPGLKAALGASAIAAPVIYFDIRNISYYAHYGDDIQGKHVWIFDNQTLSSEAINFTKSKASVIYNVNSSDWSYKELGGGAAMEHFLLFATMFKVK